MHIRHPLQMNDWEIKKALTVVLSVQFSIVTLTALSHVGVQVPLLRQFVGLLYLLLIPGVLILRVLRIHNVSVVETLLYTVGLSILSIMLTGVLTNAIYPTLGIADPLSTNVFTLTMSFVVLILCAVAYTIDKDFSNPTFVDIKGGALPAVLFCFLIPFVAIFGTHLMNVNGNNAVQLLLILTIATIILAVGFDKFIDREYYPLAIFVTALSLLFSNTLISNYLTGWDIQGEYYVANLVVKDSLWNWMLPFDYNAMPSVTILAPALSQVSGIDLIWVFKIVYPIIFAMLPLGVYVVVKKQTDSKIAFYSAVFLFIGFTFFLELPQLARQEIGEVFLILMILSFFSDAKPAKKTTMSLFFALGLALSHYSLAYLYVFVLVLVWMLGSLTRINLPRPQLIRFVQAAKQHSIGNNQRRKSYGVTISAAFVLLFAATMFVWYSAVSSSSILFNMAHTNQFIIERFSSDFLNAQSSQGTSVMLQAPTPLHNVSQSLRLFSSIMITIGICACVLKRSSFRFANLYVLLGAASYAMLVATIIVPNFAASLNVTRIYHTALIVLAPFFVVGALIFFRSILSVAAQTQAKQKKAPLKVVAVFLALFLLFDSGLISETVEHNSMSIALTKETNVPVFSEQELAAASWWYGARDNSSYVFANTTLMSLLESFDWSTIAFGKLVGGHVRSFALGTNDTPKSSIWVDVTKIPVNSYILLGTSGYQTVVMRQLTPAQTNVSSQEITAKRSLLYDTGQAKLYY